MRIVLVGFMGTGKSVVGRRLAARRGLPFLDLDAWIEERAGLPIREIFATQGEEAFRALEREAVRHACELDDVVVAAGGGTIVRDENREALSDGGVVFCLEARPDAVAHRVSRTVEERPLLAGHPDLIARIRALQEERAPAYARIANRIDTSDLDVDQVVDTIEAAVELLLPPDGVAS